MAQAASTYRQSERRARGARLASANRTSRSAADWQYGRMDYHGSNLAPKLAPEYAPEIAPDFSAADVHAYRTGTAKQVQASPSILPTLGILMAIVLVVVAALSFARIALTNAAVTTMIQSDTLAVQIDKARSTGVSLEMEQSTLASPNAMKTAVKRLGMTPVYATENIELDPDVVAYDPKEGLSFSDSVKNVVAADAVAQEKAAEQEAAQSVLEAQE